MRFCLFVGRGWLGKEGVAAEMLKNLQVPGLQWTGHLTPENAEDSVEERLSDWRAKWWEW